MPILIALVSFFAGGFVLRCLYRAWARGELAALKRVARVRPLYPSGRMVLRGRIRGGSLVTRRSGSTRTGEPWLELADGPVSFAGEVCVVHGTQFSTRWWSVLPRSERSVMDGDEVIVEGELGRAADGTRELRRTARWNPSPSIQAHAVEAIVKPGRAGLLVAALIVGSIGAASYVRFRTPKQPQRSDQVAPKPRDVCPARHLLHAVRLDEAAAAAELCGSREDKLWAYMFAGRFEDAERQLTPGDGVQPALTIEVALGHWSDAARRLEIAIDADHAAANSPDRCLVALFRSYAGEEGAFDHLSQLELDAHCQVLRALALPRSKQAAALRGIAHTDDDLRLALLVRATTSAPMTQASLEEFSSNGLVFDWQRSIWFAPFIAEAHARDKIATVGDALHAASVGRSIVRGDLAAAHRELSAIEDDYARRHAAFDIAFVEGGRLEADNLGSELVAMRNDGIPTRHLVDGVSVDPCTGPLRVAVHTAMEGDGGPLAHALGECRVYSSLISDWAALLPRVHIHREELALAMRSLRDDFTVYRSDHIPFYLSNKLTAYRTLAALSGDSEEVQRLQVIIDRHTAPLADLHKLIGFWLMTDY